MLESITTGRGVEQFCYAGAWIAPCPLLVFDSETVVFANAAALERLGYSDATDLIGRATSQVLHADSHFAEIARREIVVRTRKPLLHAPTKLLTRVGAPIQSIADIFPLSIGDSLLTLLVLEAGGSGARHRPGPPPDIGMDGPQLGLAVLEAVTTPIMMQDLTTILFANPAALAFLRANDASQIEGQPIMSIVHRDGLLAAIERVGFVFATHQPLRRVPVKLVALDSKIFYAEVDAYPLRADGRWAALLVGRFVR